MIEKIIKGDLFAPQNTTIGHGVNTFGVMGAGIAKRFKELYPDNFLLYTELCKNGTLKPGMVLVTEEKGRIIVNLASQDYPGPCARLEWIKQGLDKFLELGYTSLALPWIGCGIGGLNRDDVGNILRQSNAKITIYEF